MRYFMLVHPAFDLRWASRRWLYGRSEAIRATFMFASSLLVLAGVCLILPWHYPAGWLAVAVLQVLIQMQLLQESIRTRKTKWPRLPSAWLDAA